MRRLLTLTAAALVVACAMPAIAQKSDGMLLPKADEKAVAELKLGDPAPTLSIEKWLKGDAVSGFEKGHVYVVEFWATWCGPCVASMPHLSELQKQYKDKGVTIIGVSAKDKRGNTLDKAEKMTADKGDVMGYTVAWDKGRETNKAFMEAADQKGIPCSFVIDKQGKVAYIGHPKGLDLVLDKVIAGTWDTQKDPQAVNTTLEKLWAIYSQAEDDPKAALKTLEEYDAKYPFLTKDMDSLRFKIYAATGDNAKASAFGAKMVETMIANKDAEGLNAFSWGIVDPQGSMKFKDYDLAMKAAQKGVELTKEKNAAILDTLARCYFVKGDRQKAIEWQKKAVEVAKAAEDEQVDEITKTLREYEGGSN